VRLILIRHGETDWNRKKRYMGSADPDLNATGILQARRLRRRMEDVQVDRVYCSPLRRAAHFARVVFGRRRPVSRKGFREMDFGVMEGLTYREGMSRYPKIYGDWLADPENHTLPRGERMSHFRKRVMSSLRRVVAATPGGTVAVVTHGGVIRLILNEWVDKKDFWSDIPPLAGAHELHIRKEDGDAVRVSSHRLWVRSR